jgi:hypothetical protein
VAPLFWGVFQGVLIFFNRMYVCNGHMKNIFFPLSFSLFFSCVCGLCPMLKVLKFSFQVSHFFWLHECGLWSDVKSICFLVFLGVSPFCSSCLYVGYHCMLRFFSFFFWVFLFYSTHSIFLKCSMEGKDLFSGAFHLHWKLWKIKVSLMTFFQQHPFGCPKQCVG